MTNEADKIIEVLVTFALSDELAQTLSGVSKRFKINVVPVRTANEISDEIWRKTEILITERVIPQTEKVPNLRWIQFNYAGIDFALDAPLLQKSDLCITTLSGAAAPQAAEYAVAMMMQLSHRLPVIINHQRNHEWAPDRFARLAPREIRGSTIGLIGYGSIAREIARLLQPFNVKILACKRNAMSPQDHGYMPEGLGDAEGNLFDRLYPYQAIKSMIKNCDFVVITVPKTKETTNLIAEEELAALKSNAYLIDLSRGGVVKQSALRNALQEKKFAGAVLDVFEEEPLPKEHPLWETPNLIITPHIAGVSIHYNERAVNTIKENLERYVNDSTLLNLVNTDLGY